MVGTFDKPIGVAVAPNGDVFVAEPWKSLVKKIPKSTGTPIIIGSGFGVPTFISLASNGDVYVTDSSIGVQGSSYQGSFVKKIPGGSGTVTVTVYHTLKFVRGLCVTLNGDIYVTEDGKVIRMPGGSGRIEIRFPSYFTPSAVAVSSAGTIYAVDGRNSFVAIVKPGETEFSDFLCGGCLYLSNAIFASPGGDLYFIDSYLRKVFKHSGSTGAITSINSGLLALAGVWATC